MKIESPMLLHVWITFYSYTIENLSDTGSMKDNSVLYHIDEFNHDFLMAGIPLGIKHITHGNHKHYSTKDI